MEGHEFDSLQLLRYFSSFSDTYDTDIAVYNILSEKSFKADFYRPTHFNNRFVFS